MDSMSYLISYLLASSGLTILLVWPETGPSAWIRDKVLRRLLPGILQEVLDCYICLGFWCGLLLSPLWWMFCMEPWAWTGCLMTPAIFWFTLRSSSDEPAGQFKKDASCDTDPNESTETQARHVAESEAGGDPA